MSARRRSPARFSQQRARGRCRISAVFELVEEFVEHGHAEQAEEGEVAAGEGVAALAVFVGEVDGR
jgi:hypothetical protein